MSTLNDTYNNTNTCKDACNTACSKDVCNTACSEWCDGCCATSWWLPKTIVFGCIKCEPCGLRGDFSEYGACMFCGIPAFCLALPIEIPFALICGPICGFKRCIASLCEQNAQTDTQEK